MLMIKIMLMTILDMITKIKSRLNLDDDASYYKTSTDGTDSKLSHRR